MVPSTDASWDWSRTRRTGSLLARSNRIRPARWSPPASCHMPRVDTAQTRTVTSGPDLEPKSDAALLLESLDRTQPWELARKLPPGVLEETSLPDRKSMTSVSLTAYLAAMPPPLLPSSRQLSDPSTTEMPGPLYDPRTALSGTVLVGCDFEVVGAGLPALQPTSRGDGFIPALRLEKLRDRIFQGPLEIHEILRSSRIPRPNPTGPPSHESVAAVMTIRWSHT